MNAGNTNALARPAPPEPFALVIGEAMREPTDGCAETALRHMGFRPSGSTATTWVSWRRVFDCTSACRRLWPVPPTMPCWTTPIPIIRRPAFLPPVCRATGGRTKGCWMFVSDVGDEPSPSSGQPTRMREFFKTMVLLIDLFDASHLFWSPARLWSDAAQFRASIAEMLTSGMPPVLHLVAFRRRDDGAGASMGTRGLALFAGQELEARIPDGWTVADMVRRLSRLALDMMLNGPVRHQRTTRGLESGEWIDLSPSGRKGGDGSMVIVEFGRDR